MVAYIFVYFDGTYIRRAATPKFINVEKASIFGAFRVSLTLSAARYIAAADAQFFCCLSLSHGRGAGESVAQTDNIPLPSGKLSINALTQAAAYILAADTLSHVVLCGYNIHHGEASPLPLRVEGIRQAHISGSLFLAPEEHEYLVFYAAAGIGDKLYPPLRAVCIYPFYKPYRAHGYQVVNVVGLGIVFLERLIQKEEFSL